METSPRHDGSAVTEKPISDSGSHSARSRRRQWGYRAVWRRAPDLVFHQANDELPRVDVFRFPPTRRFWAPARDATVYVTGGMSDMVQPYATESPLRVELTAFLSGQSSAPDGIDPVAQALHNLAHEPFRRPLFLGPLHTVDLGSPIAVGSRMTAFFFAVTPGPSQAALRKASGAADLFIQAVPITAEELALAISEGSEALLSLFESSRVAPYFDLDRPSLV